MINNINAHLFDLDLDMVSRTQVIIHFMHRLVAVIIIGAIGFFAHRYSSFLKQDKTTRLTMWTIVAIVALQFTLGAATVLTERSPFIASFHVLTGAALLGACSLFTLRIHPQKWSDWKSG